MIPLCRAASSTKAELGVSQLPGSPASVEPPNNENRSAPGRIRRGEKRITATRDAATISAFQRLQRLPLTSHRGVGPYGPEADLRPLTSAFTLIEMIVVMLIIATLAALVTTAGSSMFERARKVQAKNDVTQLVTAISAFYTEYGRYPVTLTSTTTDAFFGTGALPAGCTSYGNNDVLVDVLRNNTTGANAANVALLNPRAIVFLSPPAARNTTPPKGGISQTAGTGYAVDDYMDPWGSQYAIQIDTNYDSQMTNPYSDADGSAGTVPLRFGAIVFSYGKNGARGGAAKASSSFADESGAAGAFKSSADILSWQ